jgi:predicted CoA-substrate-specific enzyme activase
MTMVLGIDLGSRTTKIVGIVNGDVDYTEIFDTGYDPLPRVGETIGKLGPSHIVATGYGRHLVRENFGAEHVTEIRACAKGAYHFFPSCRTILDVGGQDCKVICIDENGRVVDFEMNDRCAAGTGKFLEVMAGTFTMQLEDFIQMALGAPEHICITSMCTVFAESEVVSLITSGKPKEKIALGLHVAIADRLASMLGRFVKDGELLFVGGGAKNACLCKLLHEKTGLSVRVPEEPQFTIAHGAALIAAETK